MDTTDPIDGLTLVEDARRLHADTVHQHTAIRAQYEVHRASMAAFRGVVCQHQARLITMAQEQGALAEQMQVTCAELPALIQETLRTASYKLL